MRVYAIDSLKMLVSITAVAMKIMLRILLLAINQCSISIKTMVEATIIAPQLIEAIKCNSISNNHKGTMAIKVSAHNIVSCRTVIITSMSLRIISTMVTVGVEGDLNLVVVAAVVGKTRTISTVAMTTSLPIITTIIITSIVRTVKDQAVVLINAPKVTVDITSTSISNNITIQAMAPEVVAGIITVTCKRS